MIIAAAVVAANGQIEARRYPHCGPRCGRAVVHRPTRHTIVTSRVSNRFNQQERLALAIAYLNNHDHLTVKKYAKITSLNKDAAEAELDVFVMDRKIPIGIVVKGKKKLYVKTS